MKITTAGTQKESQILELPAKKNRILHYDVEYDSTKPEQTIRDFVSSVKGMISRYEANKNRIVEIEDELQDIFHYIEISTYKKVPDGYKLYRKMAELRRERRACKSEMDLLWPIYEYFHATEILNKLSHVQGECAKSKAGIDGRTYLVRSDILDEWLNPPETTVNIIPEDIPSIDADLEPVDDPETLKTPGKTETKPMSAFKQVWKAN